MGLVHLVRTGTRIKTLLKPLVRYSLPRPRIGLHAIFIQPFSVIANLICLRIAAVVQLGEWDQHASEKMQCTVGSVETESETTDQSRFTKQQSIELS